VGEGIQSPIKDDKKTHIKSVEFFPIPGKGIVVKVDELVCDGDDIHVDD